MQQNESILKQKARMRWLQDSDYNSKHFHAAVNWKRRKSLLTGVHYDRTWVDKPDEVKMLVKDFFFSRFKRATNDSEGINLHHITFPNFYELQNRFLVKTLGRKR